MYLIYATYLSAEYGLQENNVMFVVLVTIKELEEDTVLFG
jgi:hypothetical protein